MGSNVVCAPAACSNGEATPEARCDGDGNCPEVEPIACGAYRCGATACKSSCASDSDCAAGSACDVNDRCVSGSTCSDDGTTLIDSLGNERSCAPYRCASGQCGDTCESSSDCVSGFACNPSNRECEEVSKPVAEDGGCGCRVGAKSRASAWLAWLAVLGLVGFRRARHSHRLLRRTHD
jgi:MYXO-CTERM domain-containing protein